MKELLIYAAHMAGDIQREELESCVEEESKYGGRDSSDIVTRADRRCEEALRNLFRKEMMDYNVFGEEYGARYNGNGKVILIDPIDGTKSFVNKLPCFGPVIGVYENGKNIGGVEYNTLKNILFVATDETGFERRGPAENDLPNRAIYIEGSITKTDNVRQRLEDLLKEKFPDKPVLISRQDVINKTRVCEGKWDVFFHAGLARHDIAATPLFSELTNTRFTDHLGKPYNFLDAERELGIYTRSNKLETYSNKVLVAKPEYHKEIIEVLSDFRDVLG